MRRLVVLLTFLSLGFGQHANAQASVGVHYSALANDYPDETLSGIGGFAAFVRGPLGVEAATTVFPSADIGGRAWQLVAGPRVGVTWEGMTISGHIRPGFIRFSERFFKPEIACIAVFPTPEACLAPKTNFQLDLGGAIELGVARSMLLRLDLGANIIRYEREPLDARRTHGLQFSAGVGWKF